MRPARHEDGDPHRRVEVAEQLDRQEANNEAEPHRRRSISNGNITTAAMHVEKDKGDNTDEDEELSSDGLDGATPARQRNGTQVDEEDLQECDRHIANLSSAIVASGVSVATSSSREPLSTTEGRRQTQGS